MAWRREDSASTSSIGLSVAAATFAIAFATANLMVEEPGGADHRVAALDLTSSNALEVLIGQSGVTTDGRPWLEEPDLLGRFGLAQDGLPNFIDYRKIKSMRNATMVNADNNAPDYYDVKDALGLQLVDFHLRTYPIIPGVDDPRWTKDPHGRFAYFGHYSGATGSATMVWYANESTERLNVSVAIINTGSKHGVFVSNIGLGDDSENRTYVTEQRHTRLLAPGEVQTVWATFPKLQDWNDDFDAVKVDLADAYGNTLIQPTWRDGEPPEGGTVKYGVRVQANQMYYVTGDTVSFTADHYDADGEHLSADQAGRFVLVGPNGNEWTNASITLPKGNNKVYTYACANCTTVGNYTAIVWNAAMTQRSLDMVHVSAATMFDEKKTMATIAQQEVAIIKSLVEGFNDVRFDDEEAPDGDIFGDDSNGPHELSSQLSRYSTIVVGSEVSQTALNAAATKYGIAEWVQNGGNLIVLGTVKQQSNWLEPVYHAAQITANGGIGTPDPTHPVLHTPNRLDYQRYLDNARSWDIETDAPFTHVLTRGSGGDSMIDTLALAAPGAYNDGTVVLTSYMPGALTSPQDDMEAKRFLHNLFSQSYNMLFLDYGPPVPDDTPVGSAQRLVAVPHPNVPGAVVEVRIVMYAW